MNKKHLKITRILILIGVIGLSIFIYSIRDQVEKFAVFGYPGIFIISFLAYATVLLPAPGIAIVFTMGGVFNPIIVAFAAGIGAALGETFGYLAGFSSQAIIENVKLYERMLQWMQKNGPGTVLILSAIPNPFFDIVGITAGALKMPIKQFFFWCWIGETIKMTFFAVTGSHFLGLISY